MKLIPLLAIAVMIGCAQQQQAPQAPAAATPPVEATPAAASPSTERADALIAELSRREEEYKKDAAEVAARDRQARLPVIVEASTPAPSSSRPSITTSPAGVAPTASTPTVSAETGRDEAWWKNEMRTVEVRLNDNTRRLQEANDQRTMAQRQMEIAVKAGAAVFAQAQEAFNRANAEVQRLQAEVRNDSAAVERVREDARRANVPPGWLRWP